MKMKIGFALAVVLCVVAATLPCLEAKQATRAARKLKFSESSDSEISDSGTEGQLLVKDLVEPNARALKWGSTYYYRPYRSYGRSYPSYYKHGHKDDDDDSHKDDDDDDSHKDDDDDDDDY